MDKKLLSSAILLALSATGHAETTTVTQSLKAAADGSLSGSSFGVQVAEDFTLTQSGQLSSITWWGNYLDTSLSSGSFSVAILGDSAGSPGAMIDSWSADFTGTSTGVTDMFGNEVWEYNLSLPEGEQLGLTSGNYYLSVVSDLLSSEWYWAESDAGDSVTWGRSVEGDDWLVERGMGVAYSIDIETAPVPVPPAFALMLAPLGILYRLGHAKRT